MLTGRLVVDCDDQALVDRLKAGGTIDLQITDLDVGAAGALLRDHLRPLSVVALTAFAAQDPPGEREGPLVRVFLPRPQEDP